MRRVRTNEDFTQYPIGPILVHYGGEDPPLGYGPRPYRCPFHGDSSASATVKTVEDEEQWFNCHAGKGCPTGNALQIIARMENLDWSDPEQRERIEQRTVTITGEVGSQTSPSQRRRGGARAGRDGGRSGTRFRRTWR